MHPSVKLITTLSAGVGYLPVLAGGAPFRVIGARKMVAGYTGPAWRIVDGAAATTDIGFVGQEVDYAAQSALTSPRRMSVAYDQSGNGRDQIQTTSNRRPLIDPTDMHGGRTPWLLDGAVGAVKHLRGAGVTNRNNFTIFQVTDFAASIEVPSIFSMSAAYAADSDVMNLFGAASLLSNKGALSSFSNVGGSTQSIYDAIPRGNMQVIGMVSSPSGTKLIAREALVAGTNAFSSNTSGVAYASGLSTYAAYYSRQAILAEVIYDYALTDAEIAAVRAALVSMFSVRTSFATNLILTGDSITSGGSASMSMSNISRLLTRQLPADLQIANLAIGGQQMTTEYAALAARFTSRIESGKRNMLAIMGGTNDIGTGGKTDVQLLATATSFVTDLRSAGYTDIFIRTLLPRNDASWNATKEGYRVAYNAAVRGGATGADVVLDAAANVTMGDLAAPDNSTLYGSDKLHPTGAGNVILVDEVDAPAILARLAA